MELSKHDEALRGQIHFGLWACIAATAFIEINPETGCNSHFYQSHPPRDIHMDLYSSVRASKIAQIWIVSVG